MKTCVASYKVLDDCAIGTFSRSSLTDKTHDVEAFFFKEEQNK